MSLIQNFLDNQNVSLLREFSGPGHSLVAASPEMLEQLKNDWGWRIIPLPGIRHSSACVIEKEGGFGAECWARWDYRGYRKAFARYLRDYHPGYSSILNSNVDVDHLEPRYRFSKGDGYFVRLHLIDKRVNAAYGAGFEKNFYRVERQKTLHGAIHMSWLCFFKASGINPPSKSSGAVAWRLWARNQSKYFSWVTGEPAGDAYAGILAFLQLGYTGSYSGNRSQFNYDFVRDSYW